MTNHFPIQMPLSVERERYLTTTHAFPLRRGPERHVCFRYDPVYRHIQQRLNNQSLPIQRPLSVERERSLPTAHAFLHSLTRFHLSDIILASMINCERHNIEFSCPAASTLH